MCLLPIHKEEHPDVSVTQDADATCRHVARDGTVLAEGPLCPICHRGLGSVRLLPRVMCGLRDARYLPALRKSATRSPIIIVVALVLARMQSGMIEASAIRRLSSPCTRPYWSTTAMGSAAGPILQVPET